MIALLANWRLLCGVALLAALGLQTVRVGWLQADVAELRLSIAQGVAESERVTREAVEKARKEERTQLENIRAQNENTAASLRARISQTTRERDAALRSLTDVPTDACLDSALPADVLRLLRPSNPHGAGGSGSDRAGAGASGNDGGLSSGGGG